MKPYELDELEEVAPATKKPIDGAAEFTGLGRAILIAIILTQRERIAALEGGGVVLPGWWCAMCEAFNGEMHALRSVCRCCGVLKTAGPQPQRKPTLAEIERLKT